MAKTNQEYKDEYLNSNKGNTEQLIDKNRQATAASISQYNQGVDTQVQASVNPYQQRIEEAPSVFQEQYDANHITELINRKKVQESMANMGLTDSGLNRSQQTALSVQRGNADTATRKQQRDYVTAAEQAIDQIIATGESQKQQHAAQRNLEADNYESSLLQSLYDNANTYATNRVIADQEAAAKAAEGDLKWALAMLDKGYVPDGNGGYVAAPATVDQQMEASKTVQDYIAKRVADGVPYEQAVQEAAAIYGTGANAKANSTSAGDNGALDALKGITEWDASKGGLFNKTFWTGPEGDGRNVYEDIVQEQLKRSEGWLKLPQEERDIATAIAIGKSVGTTWPSQAEGNKTKNDIRIKSALKAAGFEEEYHKGDGEKTKWEIVYDIATNYYNATY